MARPSTTEALLAIVRGAGFDLAPGPWSLYRTRAGHWQRSCGAWSWWIEIDEQPHGNPQPMIGSHYPAKEMARGPTEVSRSEWGDIVLYPDPLKVGKVDS